MGGGGGGGMGGGGMGGGDGGGQECIELLIPANKVGLVIGEWNRNAFSKCTADKMF